jgi:hypothetical protein
MSIINNNITYSKVESDRFKLKVYRGNTSNIDKKELLTTILENKIDVSIIRMPSHKIEQQFELDKIGFPYICADTLVYYKSNLEKSSINPIKNDLEFIIATDEHTDILDSLINSIFIGYTNHYNSNPLLPKGDILNGYKEWARGYINNSTNNKTTWIVKQGKENIGFATCSFNNETSECEGVLYGVSESHSGMGIYGDIIRFTQNYFKENGFKTMSVSTQIQNIAVQKVWTRESFFISEAYNTYHINSLLSASINEIHTEDITINEKLINDYAQFTEDYNPIHTNEEFAKSIGLEDKIAHGIISNAILTKYYGTIFPGNGTLFKKYSYLFFLPLYINKTYTIEILFPIANKEKGLYKSVAIIKDKLTKEICLVAYNDLIKK